MALRDHVALKYFYISPKDNFLEVLNAINAAGGDAGFLEITSSFEQNLDSLMRTASLPFTMAVASVSIRYQIAERIRLDDTDEDDPSSPAKVAARLQARFELKEEHSSVEHT